MQTVRDYLIRSGSSENIDYCLMSWRLKTSRERCTLKHRIRKPKQVKSTENKLVGSENIEVLQQQARINKLVNSLKNKKRHETFYEHGPLFSEDIGVQFQVNKSTVTVLKVGKLESSSNDIVFENQSTIRSLDENNC